MFKPYSGSSKRLVLAFDVGTTFSGVSFCILDPGEVPVIRSITKYPGQEHEAGSSRIPSVIYYDKQGLMQAAGAETLLAVNTEKAEDEEWLKVQWFKLHMRPKSMPVSLPISALPPLPSQKNITHVFADFLTYLSSCAQKFICDAQASLTGMWPTLIADAVFIIGHPNGWEGAQQSKLRRSAILSRLIPNTPEGRARVKFVTEGEASLHYCIRGGMVAKNNDAFIIADLGGGTLDFSAYKLTEMQPLCADEVAPSDCLSFFNEVSFTHIEMILGILGGSTSVTQRAEAFLKQKLKDSKYGADEFVDLIAKRFDETAKKVFRSVDDVCLVTFGTTADKDLDHNIRGGKMRLSGQEVAPLFEPSVRSAVAAICRQIDSTDNEISSVYLVGGFSASPYFTTVLKKRLLKFHIDVNIPDDQTAKAVADGALLFYLNNFVSSRVAKVSYCLGGSPFFNSRKIEHIKRADSRYSNPSGDMFVRGGLFTILKKDTSVTEQTVYRETFRQDVESLASVSTFTASVLVYLGTGYPPEWKDELPDKKLLKKLCTVSADVSSLRRILAKQNLYAPDGTRYWNYDADVILLFGGPELQAQIAWRENVRVCSEFFLSNV
ncbi:hypothetical protein DFH11DRAFT_1514250 [Phellopilus nigrolimitatus]|nr:hypothetical protein DFH11DRAFT_1514250 [Phellopilus nigrolimitatus]